MTQIKLLSLSSSESHARQFAFGGGEEEAGGGDSAADGFRRAQVVRDSYEYAVRDWYFDVVCDSPRTKEIGLETIAPAKISNKFSRESPYISNTFSRESQKFQTGFPGE